MRIITILSAIVLCLTAAVPGAVAAAPVAVTDSFSRAQVGGSLEILEDPDGRLAFGEVSSGSVEKRFTGGHGEAPNFGYTRSVYWARFALSDTRASRQELFLEFNYTHLDVIDIYWRDANGAVVAKKIGKRFPYATREVKYRNPVAVIPPDAATPQTVYMRIDTGSSMQLAATLWTPRAFAEAVRHEQYVFGLFYGTMIVMAIYNLFLFFFVRDRNYLYYVLYIFAYVLVQISFNGLAFEYLWPGQVWWNGRCIPFFIGFSSLCIIQFARSFLGAKTTVPSMHRALQVLLVYAALVMAVSLAGPYQLAMKLGLVLMIVETVVISITAVICFARKYRPARYFIIAWAAFLGGIAAISLKTLGVLPDTFITNYAIQIGSSLETILLSVALADRINILKSENVRLTEIQKELDIARRIQRTILPEREPVMPRLDIQVRYLPAESVGGDFYDFHVLDRDRLGVIIADVSGHGIPAALIASMLKVAFSMQHAVADDPAALLTAVNRTLAGKFKKQFITALYAYLDLARGVLVTSNAGHFPVYVLKKGSGAARMVAPRGRVIGFLPEIDAKSDFIAVEPGDRIVLFTDGIIETRNRGGEFFGWENFEGLIALHGADSAAAFTDLVLERIRSWIPVGKKFEDDVTLIVIDVLAG